MTETAPAPAPPGTLLPTPERDEFADRLLRAVNGFVDDPKHSVDAACGVLDELSERVTQVLAERSTGLREAHTGQDTETDTERLRLALRDCRNLTERLLRL